MKDASGHTQPPGAAGECREVMVFGFRLYRSLASRPLVVSLRLALSLLSPFSWSTFISTFLVIICFQTTNELWKNKYAGYGDYIL